MRARHLWRRPFGCSPPRPTQRCWPAVRRWVPCSICAWPSRGCWSTPPRQSGGLREGRDGDGDRHRGAPDSRARAQILALGALRLPQDLPQDRRVRRRHRCRRARSGAAADAAGGKCRRRPAGRHRRPGSVSRPQPIARYGRVAGAARAGGPYRRRLRPQAARRCRAARHRTGAGRMTRIALTVNDMAVEADVVPRMHLADFLREQLLLTGTHIGCEHGICGACTVEIDGEIARSCITYAVACDGAHVRTIEGFDDDAPMARLRQAFTEAHALQCGYCTPGMLIAARDLVRRKAGLSRVEIRTEMSGNLCRCTGYVGIVDAIEQVMGETVSPSPRASSARGEGIRSGTAAADHANSWLGPAPGPLASATLPAATSSPATRIAPS